MVFYENSETHHFEMILLLAFAPLAVFFLIDRPFGALASILAFFGLLIVVQTVVPGTKARKIPAPKKEVKDEDDSRIFYLAFAPLIISGFVYNFLPGVVKALQLAPSAAAAAAHGGKH